MSACITGWPSGRSAVGSPKKKMLRRQRHSVWKSPPPPSTAELRGASVALRGSVSIELCGPGMGQHFSLLKVLLISIGL